VIRYRPILVALGVVFLGLAGCTDDPVQPESKLFAVSGSVSGLSVPGLSLQNDGDFLTITTNGRFEFPTLLENRSSYDVQVFSHPNGQTCVVANGSGTILGGDVSNILVTCTDDASQTTFLVGGDCDCDLTADNPLILSNNGSDFLTLSGGGDFIFAERLPDGASYAVAVASRPTGQTCFIFGGSGKVSGANVTDVMVSCRDL
jgi:hypothetical protein